MTLGEIDRRLAKLRAHLRTPRGRGDTAAAWKIAELNALRDGRDWYGRRDMGELLKVLYPPDSITSAMLPAMHPLLSMIRKAPATDDVYVLPVTYKEP